MAPATATRNTPAKVRRAGAEAPGDEPALVALALAAAEACDLTDAPAYLLRTAKALDDYDGRSALYTAKWWLLGISDSRRGDLTVILAIGLLTVAASTEIGSG